MNDIEIVMSNGFKTILTKPSLISKNHQFIGLDGKTVFKWRRDGMLASTMTVSDCFSSSERKLEIFPVVDFRNCILMFPFYLIKASRSLDRRSSWYLGAFLFLW